MHVYDDRLAGANLQSLRKAASLDAFKIRVPLLQYYLQCGPLHVLLPYSTIQLEVQSTEDIGHTCAGVALGLEATFLYSVRSHWQSVHSGNLEWRADRATTSVRLVTLAKYSACSSERARFLLRIHCFILRNCPAAFARGS